MKHLVFSIFLLISIVGYSQPLTILCPGDVSQGTDDGVCTAIVDNIFPQIVAENELAAVIWTLETIDPSNGQGIILYSELCGINDLSGYTFIGNLSGISIITYLIIDILGNTEICTFTIDINDDEAPTYSLPDPCDSLLFPGSINCIFPSFEEVPNLWGPPYPDIADMAFDTMLDNCLPSDASIPPWHSATMSSGILDIGDDWITYTFTAYDDEFNSNSQEMTFYWDGQLVGIPEHLLTENLKVYPNPSNGNFTVESTLPYKIYDLQGITHRENSLSPGVYILTTGKKKVKIVIN